VKYFEKLLVPSKIINRLITNFNNKTQNDKKISHLDDKIINSWFVIPYFDSFSEKFREIVGVSDIRVVYYGVNKLRNIIKAHKDPLPNLCKKNVIYKLNCNNCENTYVGQIKRQLKSRIAEHRNIKRNTLLWVPGHKEENIQHTLYFYILLSFYYKIKCII